MLNTVALSKRLSAWEERGTRCARPFHRGSWDQPNCVCEVSLCPFCSMELTRPDKGMLDKLQGNSRQRMTAKTIDCVQELGNLSWLQNRASMPDLGATSAPRSRALESALAPDFATA